MPPQLFVPADRNRILKLSSSCQHEFAVLSKFFLLALVVVIGLRLAIIRNSSRKRMISTSETIADIKEKCPISCQKGSEQDLRQYASSGEQHQQTPVYKSVYPWTSPPQPLPGPYDPRLYPLPTIRRHSCDPSVPESKDVAAPSYTRRVSLNSIPTQHSTLRGTVTISSKGWRRKQWTISGG